MRTIYNSRAHQVLVRKHPRSRRVIFERLEARELLAADWQTVGQARVTNDQVTIKSQPPRERALERSGTQGAYIALPPADVYNLDIQYQLKSWDAYSRFGGEGTGYYDVFSISLTDQPYTATSHSDPLRFPGLLYSWGGARYADRRLEQRSGTLFQSVPGNPGASLYLNTMLSTDGIDPSWGTYKVNLRDVAAKEVTYGDEGELEFKYEIFGKDFGTAVPSIGFFWATGNTKDTIIGSLDQPFFSYSLNTAAKRTPGEHDAIVPANQIPEVPEGATNIIMLVDPRNRVRELIESNNEAALPTCGTSPLRLQLPAGQEWEYNAGLKRFETDASTIFVGMDPGQGPFDPLIEVRATNAWYSCNTIHLEGNFLPAIGPLSPSLFQGTLEIKNGSTKSVTLTDGPEAGDSFTFAGAEIEFTGLRLGDDGVGLQGKVQLPPVLGGVEISVQGDNWLLFGENGVTLTGAKLDLPDVEIDVANVLELSATDMSVEYIGQDGSTPAKLRLQGKVEVPKVYGFTADLSDPNYLEFSDGEIELVGRISGGPIPILPGAWSLEEVFLEIDTTTNELVGGATVKMPTGIEIEGELGFLNGELNFVSLTANDLQKPIPPTGAFLQTINGRVNHIAESDSAPVSFGGGVGITAGPEVTVTLPSWAGGGGSASLVRLDVDGDIDKDHLVASGQISILAGVLEGNGNAELNWTRNFLEASGNFEALGGMVTLNATFRTDSNFNFSGGGVAALNMPTIPLTLMQGQNLGTGSAFVSYSNNGNMGDDYVKAWATINLPILGPKDFGFVAYFDGRGELLGELAELNGDDGMQGEYTSNQVFIPAGTPEALLQLAWSNDLGSAPAFELIGPDGTIYDEQDILDDPNLETVGFFTNGSSVAVALANPASGYWQLRLPTAENIGDAEITAYGVAQSPTISISQTQVIGDSLTVDYEALDPDSSALIGFYLDTDSEGANGIYLGETYEADGAGSMPLWAADLKGGQYYVYAVIDDGVTPPVVAYSPTSLIIQNHAPEFNDFELPEFVLGLPGEKLQVEIVAADFDGDTLSYSLVGANTGEFTISAEGLLSATPSTQWLTTRQFALEIRAEDPSGASDTTILASANAGDPDAEGSITLAENSQTWFFETSRGGEVLLQLVDSDLDLEVVVLNQANATIFQGPLDSLTALNVPAAGVYRAVVSAATPGSVGDYHFRFDFVHAVGDTIVGWVDLDVQTSYVELVAGQEIVLRQQEGPMFADAYYAIIDSQDVSLGINSLTEGGGVFIAPATGRYRLEASNNSPTLYSVVLQDVEDLPLLPFDQLTTLSFPESGTYYYRVALPDTVAVALTLENEQLATYWAVLGVPEAGDRLDVAPNQPYLMFGGGTYIVEIRAEGSGTVDARVAPLPVTNVALAFGATYTEADAESGVLAASFTGAAGQMFFLDTGDAYSESLDVRLLGPEDVEVEISPYSGLFRLPTAGVYQLFVAGTDFQVSVVDLSTVPVLQDGVAQVGNLSPSAVDYYVLPAQFGGHVDLDLVGDLDGQVYQWNDATFGIYNGALSLSFVDDLPRFVVLRNYQFDAVAYSLTANIQESSPLPYTIGTQVSVDSTQPRGHYSFTGAAGQRLYFDGAMRFNDGYGRIILLSPSRTNIFNGDLNSDFGLIELPESGTYEFLADLQYPYVLESPFTVSFTDVDSNLIATPATIADQLDSGTDSVWYAFAVQVGQAIVFNDASSPSQAGRWALVAPDGDFTAIVPLGTSFEVQPEIAGTYVLTLLGEGSDPIDYSFNLQVTAIDANQAPSDITLSNATVAENSPGAVVGTLTTFDPNEGDTHTYVVSDTRFEVVNQQLKLKPGEALNFEQVTSISLTITATDSGTPAESYSEVFVIAVTNLNDAPTDITLGRNRVFSGLAGAWVSSVSVADVDAGDTHTFTVSDNRFEVRAGHLYLKAGQSLPATPTTINLTLTARDVGLLSFAKAFSFTVEAAPADWLFAFQWKPRPTDVNADGFLTLLDAALLITSLNAGLANLLPSFPGGTLPPLFYDVNGDSAFSVSDVALIIATINAFGQGEYDGAASEPPAFDTLDAEVDSSPTPFAAAWESIESDELTRSQRELDAYLYFMNFQDDDKEAAVDLCLAEG